MRIRIDLSEEATKRLIRLAAKERRSVPLQAEVILLERLGLWPPEEDREETARCQCLGRGAAGQEPKEVIDDATTI